MPSAWIAVLYVGLVGLVGFTAAPQATSTPMVATAPNGDVTSFARWKVNPTPSMLEHYMKKAHISSRKRGDADISCVSAQPDLLVDCVEISKTPGTDYGRALILAAPKFRVIPPSLNGMPQFGSKIRIHFEFGARQ